jgi:hypothetical protein
MQRLHQTTPGADRNTGAFLGIFIPAGKSIAVIVRNFWKTDYFFKY